MTGEPWSVEFERHADRDLEQLDQPVKRRVLTAIGCLAEDPRSVDLRGLKGHAEFRLRVGNCGVIVDLEVTCMAIVIQRVLPRGRPYDR